MKEFKESKIESEEEEPFKADLRVDFIRHGKPKYTQGEIESGKFEGELIPEGIEQVKSSALELARGIDKDKELIIIWTSPKKRAQQTSEIIRDIFNEEKISIIEKGWKRKEQKEKIDEEPIRTQEPLRDVKLTGEFVGELKKIAVADWMEYWAKAGELPKGIEKPEEVKERTERLITHLERIARTIEPPKGKKLHFICVGHEETVRDLLEEAYGSGTKKGTGPNYGEVVRMDIHKSEPNKDAVLNLNYRDSKAKLNFNKERREIL
jgi:broad specificity phosphatase PhoE